MSNTGLCPHCPLVPAPPRAGSPLPPFFKPAALRSPAVVPTDDAFVPVCPSIYGQPRVWGYEKILNRVAQHRHGGTGWRGSDS